MAKRIKKAYWLLPAAALCVASVSMAITPSYARYENTAAWYTVATPVKAEVTSPYLAEKDCNLTVLAGNLTGESKEISFPVSSTADTAAVLQWQVDKPELVEISLRAGDTAMACGDTLQLSANTPAQLTITVTPTQIAAQPHEQTAVVVQLSFGEDLAGAFQVELPAVEEISPEQQPETDPVEQTDPQTKNNTDPVEEIAEIQPDETIEETLPEETLPEETEPEETEPEETEPEETQPEETQPDETPPVTLSAPGLWNPALPIPLTVTAQTDGVVSLQLLAADALQELPAATRFSMDNGETWLALYAPGKVALPVAAGQPRGLLLDVRHTALKTAVDMTFATEEGAQIKVNADTAAPYVPGENVLTQSGEISLALPVFLKDATLTYSVDILTATEEGNVYLPVSVNEGALQAELTQTEQGQQLKLFIGEQLPPAGTYRLNLHLQFGQMMIDNTEEHFFIHYGETSGGERQ